MQTKQMLKKITLFLFFIFSATILSYSQTEVRGFVYNESNGEPIIFANVYLLGTTYGSTTDKNGFYTFTRIKAGSYLLVSTYIGFDTFKARVVIQTNTIIKQNIYLKPSVISLGPVTILGTKGEKQTNVKISQIKVTPNEIGRLPSIGAQPDFAQYLQVLPGVISSGDKGGQIYIRGGTPIQNKVILDGMTIYNPFHSIGLFSVFDIDIVRSIDVYAGGFDAEYGDRISAIMDIKTIDGNKKEMSGKFGVSPFLASALLTGPIKKLSETSGSSSYLLSVRSSYLNKTSPTLYNYADTNGLPYSFTDLYGKISLSSSEGSKISFFGFLFQDDVNYQHITRYSWNSKGFGSQFLLVPTSASTIVEGSFSFSDYRIDQKEIDNKPRFSYISGFQGGMNFSNYMYKDLFKYGFELSGYKTQFQYYNEASRKIEQTDYSTNIAVFVKYKKNFKKFIIVPGIRYQYYASLQEGSLEPRLAVKYLMFDNFRIKFAGGLYSQNFISAFSDRDVVNLFYGFLSAPDNIPNTFNGKEVKTRLQKARHAILGIEYELDENNSVNIEGYYKYFNQLTNINRNKIFDDTREFQDKPEYLRSDYIIETGDAYGLNFHYIFDKKPFYIWIVYDLAFVDRYDGIATYTPNWDRRHNIQVLANYTFNKKNPWEISARWNYGSSFPFTQTQGFYEYLPFNNVTDDYTKANGELGVLYGDLNAGRLPSYHRLDISIKKTYHLKKSRKLQLTFSVTNVYDRENIFYYDRVSSTRINQLPVLPSFGAFYSFN